METNKTVFSVSIWRACFALLPGILFFTGFAYIMWQIVEAEKRDVLFYGFMLLLLIFPITSSTILLRGIFGKPPVVINEEYILLHYPFHQDKKIEWQQIKSISCERIVGYNWSRYEVALYLFPTNVPFSEHVQEYNRLKQDDDEALHSYLSSTNVLDYEQLIRVQLPNARMLKGGAKEVAKQLETHLNAYHSKQHAKYSAMYGAIYGALYDVIYK